MSATPAVSSTPPHGPEAAAAPAPAPADPTQRPGVLPRRAWPLLRLAGVLGALAMAAMLWLRPELGLPVFWGLVVPVLPLVFMLTPGLWRNLCPLATSNQLPRRLGIAKGWSQGSLSLGKAYPIGITLLIGAVIARRLVFDLSGPATAGLILMALGAAFVGGLLYKGKSGWCSSICPLLPVQRLYGQTPFVHVAHTQCDTCVGCAKNCYDFNPGVAYLADQYDPNPSYRNFRRFFSSVFPGLVAGYYLVPPIEQIGAGAVVLQMLMAMAASLAVFTLLDLVIGATRNTLPVLFAALAINLYYAFAAPLMSQVLARLGAPSDPALVGGLRTAVAIASLVWVARSLQVERSFLREQLRRNREGEIPLAPVVVETVRLNRQVIAIARADAAALGVEQADSAAPVDAARAAPAGSEVAAGGAGTRHGAGVAAPVLTPLVTPVLTPVLSAALSAALSPAASPAVATATPAGARPAGGPRGMLRIEPGGLSTALRGGRSLLDLLEGCGADIHPGCRAGACGADPIAVTGGASCLSPLGDIERATLARLGHAANTRLACMARVRQAGVVTVELRPHAAGIEAGFVAGCEAGCEPTSPAAALDTGVAALVSQPATLATQPAVLVMQPAALGGSSAEPARPPRRSALPANDTAARGSRIRRVVIVGNGIAGLTAARVLRRHHAECHIDLVTRDRQAAYNRMAVASLLTRRNGMQGLYLEPDAWYAEQRIASWLNTRATGLDTTRQIVTLATGDTLGYDRLILATGAQAVVPAAIGFAQPGCFVMRHAGDAMAVRAHLQRHEVRHATVVGAGLLGLEVAASLRDLGLEVSVLARGERVLDRQIDAVASRMVTEHLRAMSIEVIPRAELVAVQRNSRGRVRRLQLADGRGVHSELVVACIGTRPDLELARLGGLAIGRGIRVDAQMRTSDPNIHAAGDVAEFHGRMPGLWGVAAEQARVAALAALGLPASYEATAPLTTLALAGLRVRSAGQAQAHGEHQRELVLAPPVPGLFRAQHGVEGDDGWEDASDAVGDDDCDDVDDVGDDIADPGVPAAYAKLVIEGRRVMGAVFVGDDPHADGFLQAASRQAELSTVRHLLALRAGASTPPLHEAGRDDRQAA